MVIHGIRVAVKVVANRKKTITKKISTRIPKKSSIKKSQPRSNRVSFRVPLEREAHLNQKEQLVVLMLFGVAFQVNTQKVQNKYFKNYLNSNNDIIYFMRLK